MEEVKDFILSFFKLEAEVFMRKKRKSLQNYLDGVERLKGYGLEHLISGLGFPIMDEYDHEFYRKKKVPNCLPRHLFKISKYQQNTYGDIFIAYSSEQNPPDYNRKLRSIFILINDNDQSRAVQYAVNSDFSTDGARYQWEYENGYDNLTFGNLDKPIAVERYQEPVESFDGLKHYNDNI